MKIKKNKIMIRLLKLSGLFIAILFLLIQCNVIWTSPKSYNPTNHIALEQSIMSLEEYTTSGLINTHSRPYVFQLNGKIGKGAVYVIGLDHTKDPQNRQLAEIRDQWSKFNPTIALVEGRLGFLFSWIQDPVHKLGEGGLTARLAKSNGVKLYSWEPGREAEVEYLLKRYPTAHIAAFYCLRPYRSNYSGLSQNEANKVMKQLISERTNRKGIKGIITSVDQIDSLWKAEYPELEDWRTYKHPQNGWPDGVFQQLATETNSIRDVHMCNSIIELVNKGERVFVTMGASHAPRIERALKEHLAR